MRQVCALFDITRQAVYKHRKKAETEQMKEHLILQMVHEIRRKMPMVGGRKLYWMLADDMEKIAGSMGRDRFFDFLRKHGLLVRRRKRYTVTTNSHHRFRVYTNLIKELTVDAPNRVFVSDITYVRLHEGFCYLALVTDMYSRKIVGFDVSESLSLDGSLRALKMALSGVTDASKLIHHSDRGIQYCSDDYTKLLRADHSQISMGESGNPYDNAIAERVNGILKTEFLLDGTFTDLLSAQRAIREAITTYNDLRPHLSLDYLTPSMKYAA
jgi:transposase InsO family protein